MFFKKMKKLFLYIAGGIIILLVFLLALIFIFPPGHPVGVKLTEIKSIHKKTITYITVEMMKCSMGETTTMDGNLTCSELNAANVAAAAAKTLTDKNPYSIKNNAVRISTSNTKDEDVGFVNLSASDSNVIVKSCHKKPCKKSDNRQESTIEIK